MGTNYYIGSTSAGADRRDDEPGFHLGVVKALASVGKTFIWDLTPKDAVYMTLAHMDLLAKDPADTIRFHDEFGNDLTWQEFWAIHESCMHEVWRHIGQGAS